MPEPRRKGRRLEGLVAVVNGAGQGLGRATALGLADEGARIVVNDLGTSPFGEGRGQDRAQAVADRIVAGGGEAIADGGDISDWSDAEALIGRAIDAYGKLDILVNCAGILRFGTPMDASPDDFEAVLRVHLRGYFNTTHFAAKHWVARNEYGRLINFASGSSLLSHPTLVAYSTAKAGVVGLTRSCANALVSYGVTANCVRPTAATPMADAAKPESRRGSIPASRDAEGTDSDPAHIVPLVVFLASPAAWHVSGRFLEGRANHYVLWSEPAPERQIEANFLTDPEAVYKGLEDQVCFGLSLRDLKMPMPSLDGLGDWQRTYGMATPGWEPPSGSSPRHRALGP
jgi:NAD(P)-dependent dehydrogenase (short-subunit alcohol dehydrogenase family)